ncbi:MAG TPA: methylmalonyl Co-A mutase-associated GTPase MeaB [Alphaproteobacteria bacterium]|nr:methylmalonyl Co-A mutase-associated GTPase MeaB [Alphaproteobacteria bacterium]HAJ45793.1 methylmalonyl Co-A mutase-associated GTPase MeaB [Alphaproteobacteria bacterium]
MTDVHSDLALTPQDRALLLVQQVRSGDRRALAKAVTLIESERLADQAPAAAFLEHALAIPSASIRLGLSGAPGVGKSTFIEAFGTFLTGLGKRVAVLAVDPSSQRSGGSILGDKTRMPDLARDPRAFIRPSPAGETLGGVARRTREALAAVELAGFDVVLVETVGVGQSETAVAGMTDMFILLMAPGGGDDLQGIKRGIMELADLLIVTKGDGDLLPAANRAVADFTSALHLMRLKWPGWTVPVARVSAQERTGIAQVWAQVESFAALQQNSGAWAQNRAAQRLDWFWAELRSRVMAAFTDNPAARAMLPGLEAKVRSGTLSPSLAAEQLFAAIAPFSRP